MKYLQKYFYWLLCTLVLITAVFFGLSRTEDSLPRFCVPHAAGIEEITVYLAEDSNAYVFLPASAELNRVTVRLTDSAPVSLGGIPLSDGMDCGSFREDTPYSLEINGQTKATLRFYRSAKVPTLYIHTGTGSMERIHRDKNHEESTSVALYTPDGVLDYRTESGTLKGRGNATWDVEKKPYALILPDQPDLLNMGAASNWVLLANAFDETNLRNKLVFDLARQVSTLWVPDCAFVDVYLNGDYNGLYLLSEKVEIGSNRLDIHPDSGDFLCKFDLPERWDTLRNPFHTDLGRTAEITAPAVPSDPERIEALVNQLEQAILSGVDLSTLPDFDLDSWVYRYLIDEIAGNIDADLASSYFYYADGVFYAGPLWDYDITFGNTRRNASPVSFIARNEKRSYALTAPYNHALYQNPSFYARMQELYQRDFLPALADMQENRIAQLASEIDAAARMNRLRWESMYRTMQQSHAMIPTSPDTLADYLLQRSDFLSQVWIEEAVYCTVQYLPSPVGEYQSFSVEQGRPVPAEYRDQLSGTWYDEATGELVDFSGPITRDITVVRQLPKTDTPEEESFSLSKITLLAIAILIALFVIFLLIKV